MNRFFATFFFTLMLGGCSVAVHPGQGVPIVGRIHAQSRYEDQYSHYLLVVNSTSGPLEINVCGRYSDTLTTQTGAKKYQMSFALCGATAEIITKVMAPTPSRAPAIRCYRTNHQSPGYQNYYLSYGSTYEWRVRDEDFQNNWYSNCQR